VADAGRSAAHAAADASRTAANAAGRTAEQAVGSTGQGLQSLAGQVREYGPHSGVLGQATDTVASGLEQGGQYLKDQGLSGMADDLTEMIKRNPIPALLLGVGVGFVLARLTSSRS